MGKRLKVSCDECDGVIFHILPKTALHKEAEAECKRCGKTYKLKDII